MKNRFQFLLIIIIICINGIFAFNSTLLNDSISNINEIELNTSFSISEVIEINPYKNKELKNIKLRYSEITLKDKVDYKIKDKLNKIDNKEYVILEFNSNPSINEINELKNQGINLVRYISQNSWYAKITNKYDNIFEEDSKGYLKLKNGNFNNKYLVRNIEEIKNEYKAKSKLLERKFSFWTKDEQDSIYLIVKFYSDVTINEAKYIIQTNNMSVLNEIKPLNSLTIKITEGDFNKLLNIKEVLFIQELPFYFGNQLDESRGIVNVETLQNPSTYNLTGNGITILQYESFVPFEHSDLNGRINNQEPFSSDENNHATRVAGIMIGDGTINSTYKGIATKADLVVYETDYSGAQPRVYNVTNQINSEYLDGIRDEISIWNRTLDSDEIEQLYNTGIIYD